jgi:uncharacterized membrane protein
MISKDKIKEPIKYIYTTTVSGLILIAPLVIILVVVIKLSIYLIGLVRPALISLQDLFGANDVQPWAWIVLLVVTLFLAGLFFKIQIIKRTVGKLEDRILSLFPGYRMLKSLARSVESSEDQLMKPAMLKEEETWMPCFLIEQTNDLATIFIPEAPNVNAGDIKIVRAENIIILPITNLKMTMIIRDYGLGLHKWVTPTQKNLG